jgi:regulatory protein
MNVTQVEPQKKNPRRFNIFLDGQFAFGADEDLVVDYRLVVGKNIDSGDLEKIIFDAEVGKLMERVYGLSSFRMRSEKEVRDYLKRLSFKRKLKGDEELSPIVIESTIDRAIKKGLINDKDFAKAWIDSRRKSKNKGKIALKQELFQKGIDKEIVEENLTDSEGEGKLAEQAIEKKSRIWKNLSKLELRKKATDFLMRKGFEYSVVKAVVDKLLQKEYNTGSSSEESEEDYEDNF